MIMIVRGASAEEVLSESKKYDKTETDSSNEYAIVDTRNGFYELIEISRFVSGGECSELSMVTINRFSKAKLEWEKPLQRFKKRE